MNFKLFSFIFFILIFFGCKAKHDVIATDIPLHDSKSLSKLIEANSLNSSSIYFKKCIFSISIDSKQHSLNGSIYLIKDSSIIISLQALLGIEVARVRLTPTDVTVIDRLNKSYTVYTYQQVGKKFGVYLTYKNLELLLLNHPFDFDSSPESIDYKSFVCSIENGRYYLSNKSTWSFFKSNSHLADSQVLEFLPITYVLSKNSFTLPNYKTQLNISYSNFEPLNQLSFPRKLLFDGTYNDHSFMFDLTFNMILTEVTSGLSFNIPSGYEKVTK